MGIYDRKFAKPAFSLIELLVVISIVGLLSIVALPSYKGYMFKAKMSSLSSTISSLRDRAAIYYNIYGVMPDPAQNQIDNPISNLFLSVDSAIATDFGCNNRSYLLLSGILDPSQFPNGYVNSGDQVNIIIEPSSDGSVWVACTAFLSTGVDGNNICALSVFEVGGDTWSGC